MELRELGLIKVATVVGTNISGAEVFKIYYMIYVIVHPTSCQLILFDLTIWCKSKHPHNEMYV